MKLVRYEQNQRIRFGVLKDGFIRPLAGAPYNGLRFLKAEPVALAAVKLLCPATPTKVLAVGFNYRDHAIELNKPIPTEPAIFMKPVSCLAGSGDPVRLPSILTKQVEYEAELVAVIGKRARNVPKEKALEHVLGYTCGNDVTARDLQKQGKQWDFCKGYDTFGPIGPWIETEADGGCLNIQMRVNGQVRQQSNTCQLIFSVPFLVSYLSQWMTLEPGDVIFTGTPYGVAPLKPGDVMEVEIEGIGTLQNEVRG